MHQKVDECALTRLQGSPSSLLQCRPTLRPIERDTRVCWPSLLPRHHHSPASQYLSCPKGRRQYQTTSIEWNNLWTFPNNTFYYIHYASLSHLFAFQVNCYSAGPNERLPRAAVLESSALSLVPLGRQQPIAGLRHARLLRIDLPLFADVSSQIDCDNEFFK